MVRTYELIYLDALVGQDLPLNNVSLLKQVKVIGHDDNDETEELPPLEFGYTQFNPEGRKFFPLPVANLPTGALDNPDIELADLFGNGMPDILQMNGTVRYWRNRGNGQFDPPRPMSQAPAGVRLADTGVQMLDANGDGRIDLMVTSEVIAGYYGTRPEGLWERRAFQPYDFAPSFNLEDPEVQLIDLDGDGVTDAIRSGTRLECFFNHPQKGWYDTKTFARGDIKDFPNVNFSDPRVKWGDMSGDGMQDMVLVHDGNVEYYPNLGYGRWGKGLSMQNSPRFRYGYDPRRILLGDVDGDGLTDIVYVDDRVSQSTSYEIINDGSTNVAELKDAIASNTVTKEIIAQSFNYYDGAAFTGLALGEIGDRGALVRTESLVLTEDILRSAYQQSNATIPPYPYLDANGTNWTGGEYPQKFRDSLANLAGYDYCDSKYYVTTQRSQYDFQQANGRGKGLVTTMRDPLGRDTQITYDRYGMLPESVTDALGLTTTANYDYRVLQPNFVTDPNGNKQQFGFTSLGLPKWAAIIDKKGEGDTPKNPSKRFEYNFLAFVRDKQPIAVRTITREHHFNEPNVPAGEKDNTIETVEYSDGFGRLLQTRSQSEDVRFGDETFGTGVTEEAKVTGRVRQASDPVNVVVSGWQVYDNKGQVVKQYEPFYSTGYNF